MTPKSPPPKSTRLKGTLAFLLLSFLFAAAATLNLEQPLRSTLAWIDSLGPWSPLLFILIYIVACVLLVPGFILTLGAGILFGVVKGSIYVSIGATVGATCAFLVGRTLARDWLVDHFHHNPKFQAIDRAVAREGWKIVGLLRLSPVIPFNLLNYALGLTHVRLKHYFFASLVGMLPATILFVYLGSLAGDLAQLTPAHHPRSRLEWAWYSAGLGATAFATLYLTRLAKRALAQHIPKNH